MIPKLITNRPKIIKNSSKISPQGPLGGSWQGLGRHLGPKMAQDTFKERSEKIGKGLLGPKILPKSSKNRAKIDLKSYYFFDWLLDRFLIDFGANLVPTWPPKSRKNRSKSHQKSIESCILLLIPFGIEFWSILASTWDPRTLQKH